MSGFIMLQNGPVAKPPPPTRRRRSSKQSSHSATESKTSKLFSMKTTPLKSRRPSLLKAPSVAPGEKSRQHSVTTVSSQSRGGRSESQPQATPAGKKGSVSGSVHNSSSFQNGVGGGVPRTLHSGGPVVWSPAYAEDPAEEAKANQASAVVSNKSRGSIAHSVAPSGQTSAWSTFIGTIAEGTNFAEHTTKITAHKKVYNPNTLHYMDYRDTLDLFERKLYEFHQKSLIVQESLNSPWVYHAANKQFHSLTLANGVRLQDHLLLWEHMLLLRYNYFVKFQPNVHYVEYCMQTTRFPFMSYVPEERKFLDLVQEYKRKRIIKKGLKKALQGASPSLGPSISVESGLSQMKSHLKPHDPSQAKTALKSYILQTGFWWDVYQDIRRDPNMKQFLDYLPSEDVTQTLFIELLDFFIQRFRMLGCEISDSDREILSLDELHELSKNFFCYLDAADHAQVVHFQLFLEEHYLQQARVYVQYATPALMREVLLAVTACVCDNLRMQCHGKGESDEIFSLLEEFTMVCIDIVLADWNHSTGCQSLQQASTNSVFDAPFMDRDTSSTRHSLPTLSPICENPKAPKKKESFFSRIKRTFKR